MSTHLTNLTDSATLTLLTLGTRSLAPVVEVNMARASALYGRHRSHLRFGPDRKPAGIFFVPIDPEGIGIDRRGIIPGSPLGGGWSACGRSQRPSSWSTCSTPSVPGRVGRRGVSGRVVVGPERGAGAPDAPRLAAFGAEAATRRVHAPIKAEAASKRPAVTGG